MQSVRSVFLFAGGSIVQQHRAVNVFHQIQAANGPELVSKPERHSVDQLLCIIPSARDLSSSGFGLKTSDFCLVLLPKTKDSSSNCCKRYRRQNPRKPTHL